MKFPGGGNDEAQDESRSARTARIEIQRSDTGYNRKPSRSARTARIEMPKTTVLPCGIWSRSARTARIEIRTVPRADVTAGVAVRKDRED